MCLTYWKRRQRVHVCLNDSCSSGVKSLSVTSLAAPFLCWTLGGSAAEQPDCERPGCCNTALLAHCGSLCPTVVNRWCIATPWGSAPTQRPTLCSSGAPGPTPERKPAGKGNTRLHFCVMQSDQLVTQRSHVEEEVYLCNINRFKNT